MTTVLAIQPTEHLAEVLYPWGRPTPCPAWCEGDHPMSDDGLGVGHSHTIRDEGDEVVIVHRTETTGEDRALVRINKTMTEDELRRAAAALLEAAADLRHTDEENDR